MKLQTRLISLIGVIMALAFVGLETLSYQRMRAHMEEEVITLAEQIRGVLMATRRYYHHQFINSGVPLTPETLGFLPAYALSRISREFPNWSDYDLTFNNVSDQARNPGNRADAIEMEAIRFFRDHPREERRFVAFENRDGRPFYHYARPIRVEKYCLQCHGDPKDAPATIRDTYTTGFGYHEGDLRGILSIKVPADTMEGFLRSAFLQDLVLHVTAFAVIFLTLVLAIRRHVGRPLALITGEMAAVAAGGRDTALRELEGDFAQIARSFQAMADGIRQREAALTAARDTAERAGHAKVAFLSSMSHEIRTPMNAILGMCNLLEESALDPRQQGYLETLEKNGGSLLALIDDILDFSRLNAGEVALESLVFDLPALVEEVLGHFRLMINADAVTLEGGVAPGIAPLRVGDPLRLRQILIHLLGNAVKFTPAGSISLMVTGDEHPTCLLFSLRDTGVGIAPEEVETLFDPFTQSHKLARKSGLGLGLGICRHLVARMGGWIRVESQPHQGSLFQFTVCLPEAGADAARPGAEP